MPARMLPAPVTAQPRRILPLSAASMRLRTDSMEPNSLMSSAKKHTKNEMTTGMSTSGLIISLSMSVV